MVAIFFISIILFFLTVDFFVQRYTFRMASAEAGATAAIEAERPVASPELAPVPAGVFLDPGHTWVRLAPTGLLRVGADALATALLGRPDGLELKAPGDEVARGEVLATVLRGGRRLELRSPIDGTVKAVNAALAEAPDGLADAPFDAGWLYQVEPRKVGASLKRMRIAEEAAEWMRAEARRFRDAVADLARPPELAGATALDGGVPVAGVATLLDDEGFERLAERFFHPRDDADGATAN